MRGSLHHIIIIPLMFGVIGGSTSSVAHEMIHGSSPKAGPRVNSTEDGIVGDTHAVVDPQHEGQESAETVAADAMQFVESRDTSEEEEQDDEELDDEELDAPEDVSDLLAYANSSLIQQFPMSSQRMGGVASGGMGGQGGYSGGMGGQGGYSGMRSSGQCIPNGSTGGTCRVRKCSKSRGPTVCQRGQCVCPLGYCAMGGKCFNSLRQCPTATGGTCRVRGCKGKRGKTTCSKGSCICSPGHCAYKGVCYSTFGTGGSCRFVGCFGKNTRCVQRHCLCQKGYVSIGKKCVPFTR